MEYKICAWDVGIKNLAYCILIVKEDAWSIEKWDNIDIISNKTENCCALVGKTNKLCNKIATFCGKDITNTEYFYCGSHKAKYKPFADNEKWEQEYTITIIPNKMDKINMKKCTYSKDNNDIKCNKNATCMTNDENENYYCNAHKKIIINKIKKSISIGKIKLKKCYNADPQSLAESMYEKLDAIPELLTVDYILIENQPTLKNPTMKTISSMLFSYFILRGITDNKNNDNHKKIKSVRFIAPSSKLRTTKEETLQLLNKIEDTDKIYSLSVDVLRDVFQVPDTLDRVDTSSYFIDPIINNENHKLKDIVNILLKYIINKNQLLDEINTTNIVGLKISHDVFVKTLSALDKKDKNKKVYQITKLLSIKYAELLVGENEQWLNHLNSFKKKDDVCDALLHGYNSKEFKLI